MKKKFVPAYLEIILVDDSDIITTSGGNPFVDDDANGSNVTNPGGWA